MSVGFNFPENQRHDGLYKAILHAYDKNVVMFAAASNDGNMAGDGLQGINYPARDPHVFCVHSADGYGNTSSYNPRAVYGEDNFSFLGQSVCSAWPKYIGAKGTVDAEDGTGTWKYSSGTSVATPVAASIAALVLQFGETRKKYIDRHKKLRSHQGMRQLLAQMAEKESWDGFRNIRPWNVLQSRDEEKTLNSFNTALNKI